MCKDGTGEVNLENKNSNYSCLEAFFESYFVSKIDAGLKTEDSLKHVFCMVV